MCGEIGKESFITRCCRAVKGLILTSDCQQLERLRQDRSKIIERKQLELINIKDVVFHHGNARPPTYLWQPIKN